MGYKYPTINASSGVGSLLVSSAPVSLAMTDAAPKAHPLSLSRTAKASRAPTPLLITSSVSTSRVSPVNAAGRGVVKPAKSGGGVGKDKCQLSGRLGDEARYARCSGPSTSCAMANAWSYASCVGIPCSLLVSYFVQNGPAYSFCFPFMGYFWSTHPLISSVDNSFPSAGRCNAGNVPFGAAASLYHDRKLTSTVGSRRRSSSCARREAGELEAQGRWCT